MSNHSAGDHPLEWEANFLNLQQQGWKLYISGKRAEWHQKCNLWTVSTNFCTLKAYPLKGGAALLSAEQKMDNLLQMMSQTQLGQTEARTEMLAIYGEQQAAREELKVLHEEQLEANKKAMVPCLRG